MEIEARLCDAAMAVGVQTSSPSEHGSSGRAQKQEVKYRIEKWDSLHKNWGIARGSGEGSRAEGACMTCNAVSDLHLHSMKTFPLSVLTYSTYIYASLGLSQLGTLVLESVSN